MKQFFFLFLILVTTALADYPDQAKVSRSEEMWKNISSNSNVVPSEDGKSLELVDGVLSLRDNKPGIPHLPSTSLVFI